VVYALDTVAKKGEVMIRIYDIGWKFNLAGGGGGGEHNTVVATSSDSALSISLKTAKAGLPRWGKLEGKLELIKFEIRSGFVDAVEAGAAEGEVRND
jgi:hypothetical protein